MADPCGVIISKGPQNWSIMQQMKGEAAIILQGTWFWEQASTADEFQVYARVIREEDASEILTWKPCEMLPNREWSCLLDSVPTGGLYRIETCLKINHNPTLEWAIRGDMIHHIGVGDLWVIAGQSNAAGYGKGPFNDPAELGIHLLRNSGRWDLATHPFNESTNTIHSINRETANPGHSPFLIFGKMIKKHVGYPIGLIQTALGGSPLKRWNPAEEGDLYANMLSIIESAGGTVRGVVWYQGCSDCNADESVTYLDRFNHMVMKLRQELENDSLPVLTVQLNRYTGGELSEMDDKFWGSLREAQRQAALMNPHVYIIPASDCPLSDDIHNSPAGNMLIGERLAKLALANIYDFSIANGASNVESAVLEEDRITLKFTGISERLLVLDPHEKVFAIEDENGSIEVVKWFVSSTNSIQVFLKRKPVGKTYIHGAFEKNPAFFLPIDTGTYTPILSFYKMEVKKTICD